MSRLCKAAIVTVLSMPICFSGARAEDSCPAAIGVINEYFELVARGSYDIAGDMWTPEALERSGRFSIRFNSVPLKVDCNSPIMRNVDQFSGKVIAPIRACQQVDSTDWYRLEYADIYGSSLLRHDYFLQKRGDWFWIGYPQDHYAATWSVTESRYFRIRTHPDAEKYLNPAAIAEADRFVEQTCSLLGIADSTLRRIAAPKIEYYFCPTDSVVKQITGFLVVGTLDLASNDIITADFPHFHELTHLLINIRLREVPLYTLPIMREGLATYLAGRWGKHPAPLMDLAIFLYNEDLVTFDSIFTMAGFDTDSGADIVYPVAGLFCGYLIEKLGMYGCLDLYVSLSGRFPEVNGLTPADVQSRICAAVDQPHWAGLKTDFEAYLARYQAERVVALPGEGARGEAIMNGDRIAVYDAGDWIGFEFVAAPDDTLCQGNLVFAPADGLQGQRSQLFESQYSEKQAFEGYRFGVRYDRNEAGLYDYATNQLLAKFIMGITPSDDYFDAERKIIKVRFRKSLLNGQLPASGQYRLLPL
ncbi:MAG: hypothetical protein AB1772_07330 [Candidatus Zixiibacteriota bacterium]